MEDLGMTSFWNNKRVLITGHTGFKGSWLTFWLNQMGAKVFGYSLQPDVNQSLFSQLKLELDSKPWLSEKEKISTLNLATDIISHWRTNRNTDAVQKVANNFSEAVFVDLNC